MSTVNHSGGSVMGCAMLPQDQDNLPWLMGHWSLLSTRKSWGRASENHFATSNSSTLGSCSRKKSEAHQVHLWIAQKTKTKVWQDRESRSLLQGQCGILAINYRTSAYKYTWLELPLSLPLLPSPSRQTRVCWPAACACTVQSVVLGFATRYNFAALLFLSFWTLGALCFCLFHFSLRYSSVVVWQVDGLPQVFLVTVVCFRW